MVVSAKEILAEAEALRETMISDRRTLHAAPEAGADLPRTREYVAGRLREMGYEPKELAGGITAEITGSDTGACVLLRADMDALCVTEQTDLPFRSQNGCMHACGHDMHTVMLLGAAKLLRGYQSKLNGTVKLVFQPDEEGFTGAKAMLAAGVLREPAPQAGFALHVHSGTPSGLVLCGEGTFMAGCTLFRVTVHGTGCHGAMPETGVDPIHIAANIYLALEELVAREVAAKQPAVITVGRFTGGDAPNIIPSSAILEGTIRTFDRELSACLLRRIGELAQGIAAAYRGTAEVCELASAPPLKMMTVHSICPQPVQKSCSAMRRSIDSATAAWGRRILHPIPTSFPAPICFSAPGLHRRIRAMASRCTTRRLYSMRISFRAAQHCIH